MSEEHSKDNNTVWSALVGANRLPPRGAAYAISDNGHYERFAIDLIEKSGLSSIVGDCKQFARNEPMLYHGLAGVCRMMAMFEVGEAAGIIPPEASSESFSKMLLLLDSHIAVDPRFKDKSDTEKKEISHAAALEFKSFCRSEIVKTDGIIACALNKGIGQAQQSKIDRCR